MTDDAYERMREAARPKTADDCYGGSLRAYLGDDEPDDDDSGDWIIRGIIPAQSPCSIAGAPKSHKTFTLEHAGICVAAGLDWLGHFRTTPGGVLLLPQEDTLKESRRRLWRLSRGLGLDPRELDGKLAVDSAKPFYFDDPAALDRMRRTLDRTRPVLVGLDSLSRMHRTDENSKRDMAPVTAAWADLCREYGCALCVVHHYNGHGAPGDTRSPGHRMRGTSDLFALVRHVVGVEHFGDKRNLCRLTVDGNLEYQPAPFIVGLQDGEDEQGKRILRLEYRGEAADVENADIDATILAALAKGPTSQRAIEEAVGRNHGRVRGRLKDLARQHRITRDGDKQPWRLTVAMETIRE